MLNNKATQAKLESANYLATQTKQCANKVTKTKLATQGSYFYATQVGR
jgi:hypothetical protein